MLFAPQHTGSNMLLQSTVSPEHNQDVQAQTIQMKQQASFEHILYEIEHDEEVIAQANWAAIAHRSVPVLHCQVSDYLPVHGKEFHVSTCLMVPWTIHQCA